MPLKEILLRCMSELMQYDFSLEPYNWDDTFWSLGFNDILFNELIQMMEYETGIVGVANVICINDTVNGAAERLLIAFE